MNQAVRDDLTLLDVDELCALLKVTKAWVWDHCQSNDLPHKRIGGHLRFQPAAINAWLEGK